MKRTHRKVRTGCLTCRRRRIRCDELRPECLSCRTRRRFDPSIQCEYPATEDSASISAESSTALQESVSNLPLKKAYHPCPIASPDTVIDDKYLLNHVAKICVDLEGNGGHGLFCGLSVLVEGYHRSETFEFLRHALCELAASHLSLLTKSISLVSWKYHHRGRAIHSLLACLQTISKNSVTSAEEFAAVDAILVASFILSWCAGDSREYTQFLRGILSTLHKAKHDALASSIISLFVPNPSSLDRPIPPSIPSIERDALSDAAAALASLHKLVKTDEELDRGVSELRNYIQNIRRGTGYQTEDAQLAALFPIRNWFSWMPHGIYRLIDGDINTLLVLAHYEMVKIAIEPLLPIAEVPLAISKRAECMEFLNEKLIADLGRSTDGTNDQEPGPSIALRLERKHIVLMDGPMQYVRRYRESQGVP